MTDSPEQDQFKDYSPKKDDEEYSEQNIEGMLCL